MSGFFEELQRRKVYRVAAAYIVVAGFLIQIASAAFPAWELPNWSLRLVIALLLIGFPIALILAWAYDVTPQGIQATPKVPAAHRRRNLVFLIATAAVLSAAAGFFLLPRASARKIDTIGGNVLQSVARRRLRLNEAGVLSRNHSPESFPQAEEKNCLTSKYCKRQNLNLQYWSVLLQLK